MRFPAPAVGLVVLLLAACAANVPEPLPEHAGGDEAALADLREGRTLYVSKCGGCHALIGVDRYSDERWRRSVKRMIDIKKVRLTDDQRGAIERYLCATNGRD